MSIHSVASANRQIGLIRRSSIARQAIMPQVIEADRKAGADSSFDILRDAFGWRCRRPLSRALIRAVRYRSSPTAARHSCGVPTPAALVGNGPPACAPASARGRESDPVLRRRPRGSSCGGACRPRTQSRVWHARSTRSCRRPGEGLSTSSRESICTFPPLRRPGWHRRAPTGVRCRPFRILPRSPQAAWLARATDRAADLTSCGKAGPPRSRPAG